MTRYYTGVGSRSTPPHVLALMAAIAQRLSEQGFTLRSGGADGGDTAFEMGAVEKQIYIPWSTFAGPADPNVSRIVCGEEHLTAAYYDEARVIAERHHPAWERCSSAARKLHTRNVFQVLGYDLQTPSEFVICWTPEGSGKGGTGQAIRIAKHYDVPVYDLGHPDVMANNIVHLPKEAS